MTSHKDDNSKPSSGFLGRRFILAVFIVLIAGVAFGVWFFFISDSDNGIEDNGNFLPPNCYSINGKQTCSKP
jgi:hypothetical protein